MNRERLTGFKKLAQNLRTGLQNPAVRRALKILQWIITGLIFLYLIHRVEQIGWTEIRDSLPSHPAFYMLFFIIYLCQPASELIIYRIIWKVGLWRCFPVFIRKKIFNTGVMGYSGEAYLCFWAIPRLPLSQKEIFSTVKDNNILSALTSNSMTVFLLTVFFLTGQIKVITNADPSVSSYLLLAAVITVILVPVVIRFRRHILALPKAIVQKVLAVHVSRLFLVLGLQILQWSLVLPEVPVTTWVLLITAQMVLTRIPFLPNSDLIFLGVCLSMTGFVEAPEARVAGMFVTAGALGQCLNLLLYAVTSFGNFRPVALSRSS
ncbi:hypothetical protein [Emcibacter sp.]|uniref:hypothetical protein n=1 Tax=Emcibacter sp. TaxID=1979954 RepID=UPI002AA94B35|nr:hypothetical protein [Emcibacter sp.]